MAIKKEDYICLSAMLRAREIRLLTNEKAIRMIDAASFEEACKVLIDCGYEDLGKCTEGEINIALEDRLSSVLSELKRLTPDVRVLDLFASKYDYHNAKVLIKSESMHTQSNEIMSNAGRISTEKLSFAFTEEIYRDIPVAFAKAIVEAKEVLARTANPQKADFILDKAYFKELLMYADEIGCDYVNAYVKLLIDSANLKSYVRSKKMGKSEDFLSEALISDGNVSTDRILSATDGEALSSLFVMSPLEEAATLGKEVISGGRMTAFELACDNAVNAYLRKSRLITYGPEAVLSYLASLETELTAVRMILSCNLAGVNSEVIKERLREMYA